MFFEFKDTKSVYKPKQKNLIFPHVKKYENIQGLRDSLKKKLVLACRAFSYFKFDYGFAGHLTIRDPEHKNLILD